MPKWIYPDQRSEMAHLWQAAFDKFQDIEDTVRGILREVSQGGDEAVLAFGEKFDGLRPAGGLMVPPELLKKAEEEMAPSLVQAMKEAIQRLKIYYAGLEPPGGWTRTRSTTLSGIEASLRFLPLERVGVYVPGGRFPLVSSLLMGVIPAQVAGVTHIMMAAPPDKTNGGLPNAGILAAASILGIEEVAICGGAQAIGAMAYGTESIKKVDKIVGPGNRFVACAKKLVYGDVGIDMIAGPTEILILADASLRPNLALADSLAQLEHGPDSRAFVVSAYQEALDRLEEHIQHQTFDEEMQSRIDQNLHLVLTPTIEAATEFSNLIAPEHLELMMRETHSALSGIRHAGAIFLGDYTPEAACDYFGGGNHVLPTEGNARFASVLGPWDFIRVMPVTHLSESALKSWLDQSLEFAKAEGLEHHGNSLKARFQEDTRES